MTTTSPSLHPGPAGSAPPRLLLICHNPPIPGPGSGIILLRHVTGLIAKGWEVSVVLPGKRFAAGGDLPPFKRVIPLPPRRWWWPPFREYIPGAFALRLRLWQAECERALDAEPPSAILALLWEEYPSLALRLSKRWNIPLSVLIHDQYELWLPAAKRPLARKRSEAVLNAASRVWAVSTPMKTAYQIRDPQKVSVLTPMPDSASVGFAEWQDRFASPVVVHGGSLHPFQLANLRLLAAALRKAGGTLLLMSKPGTEILSQLQSEFPNIEHRPLMGNAESIRFVTANASCFLVSYAFDAGEQPWARTSFPSKLAEYAQTGLPALILAPPGIAVSEWAEQRQWQAIATRLEEACILPILEKLRSRPGWQEMAAQTRAAAMQDFNPSLIQAQFESELPASHPLRS